ncbi:MAG: hypothetical protein QM496_08655 [Verrucomicrobiota bacterium]
MKIYEIVYDEDEYEDENDDDAVIRPDKGPYTFEEIEGLVGTGEITQEQDIRKLGTEGTFSADYVLIFDRVEEQNEIEVKKATTNKLKAVIGIGMIVMALVFLAMIIHGAKTGQRVRGRQIIIIGVLGLAGAKVFMDNTGSKKSKK